MRAPISVQRDVYLDSVQSVEALINEIEEIVKSTGESLEGNCCYVHGSFERSDELLNKQINLFSAARVCDSILEIGFNAGHSALIMLLSNPDAKVVSFDLGTHMYTTPCYEALQRYFPGRIELILGNSIETVSRYFRENRSTRFDLYHIDGGHNPVIANKDFINCYLNAHDGSYVIWDDIQFGNLRNLWLEYQEKGYVQISEEFLETSLYKHSIGIVTKARKSLNAGGKLLKSLPDF